MEGAETKVRPLAKTNQEQPEYGEEEPYANEAAALMTEGDQEPMGDAQGQTSVEPVATSDLKLDQALHDNVHGQTSHEVLQNPNNYLVFRPKGPPITENIQKSFKAFMARSKAKPMGQSEKDGRSEKQACEMLGMRNDQKEAMETAARLVKSSRLVACKSALGGGENADIASLTKVHPISLEDFDLIPNLSRVFRWREQVFATSQEKHVAYDLKEHLGSMLNNFISRDQWKIPCRVLHYLYCFETGECACQNMGSVTVERTHISGSVREGTEKYLRIHGSDVDFMFQLGPIVVLSEADVSSSDLPKGVVVRQEVTEYPGFVRLRHLRLVDCDHQGQRLFSSRRVQHFMQRFQELARIYAPGVVVPYKSSIGYSEKAAVPLQLGDTSIDLVVCVVYPIWPSAAYRTRRRPSGWPSAELVARLCSAPAFLVTAKLPESVHNEGSWRLSFSRQESVVIRSMSKVQRTCLTMLKHCTSVQSYLLKTALMWQCETRCPSLWTWRGMLESMTTVLDFLLGAIWARHLPCYFYSEMNLLTGRRDLLQQARDIERARSRLVPAAAALTANLLRSEHQTLMRHLLGCPVSAEELLRQHGIPAPAPGDLLRREFLDVRALTWSDAFLETFRWETLPPRCRGSGWFAEHGLDTDSSGDEEDPMECWLDGR